MTPWNNKVIWSEGMFLQPQHFQQHDRYLERLVQGRAEPLQRFSWGFTQLEIDASALALGKLMIASARGILPDGTPFDFPGEDAPPSPLDVDADLKDEIIYLALPLLRPGTDEACTEDEAEAGLTRFAAQEVQVRDSNAGADGTEPVEVGQLRLRLLRAREATDAYALLGVVKIIERRADNQLVLHKSYIPPVLNAASNGTLAGYVRELQALLHQRGDTLASRLAQPGRGGVAEIADFLLLQTVNRYEPLFTHLVSHPLLHPERLYSTCLEVAGDLATLSHPNRRPPALPPYQHDALEASFAPLMAELRRSLSMVLEQTAVPIELQERKYGVRVAVIPDLNLLKTASFVLAVNAQLPGDALRSRFPAQSKIGPVEKIRDLVNLQLPGIPMRALPVAPRQLPYHAGFTYFEFEAGGDLWKQLERSGGLAFHIAGDFPGLELEFWAIKN